MAKRFTDTEIWDKEWFMKLAPKYKLLIKFIFDKCDVAGIWDANWFLASTYIGEIVAEGDLKIFEDHVLKISAGKFFVKDFIEFQYGTLSEKCNPHIKVISTLKKYNLFEGYLKGILRDKDKDKDKEEEEDKEKEVAEKISEILESEIWLQGISMQQKKETEITKAFLSDFLNEQKLKDEIHHRSIKEIKKHFINWLKIEIKQKDATGKNKSTPTESIKKF